MMPAFCLVGRTGAVLVGRDGFCVWQPRAPFPQPAAL